MNLNNNVTDDDEQLIRLLRQEVAEEPSVHFTENTLNKVLAFQQRKKTVYKPLRAPLYIMLTIAILLAVPFFLPTVTSATFTNPVSVVVAYMHTSIISEANIWYWTYTLILCLTLLVIMIYEEKRINV